MDTTVRQQTDDALTLFRRTFIFMRGGLKAQWGEQTEEAFQQDVRALLQEVGFATERFLDYDATGDIFGYPEQIALDIVIQNGKTIVVEIKSALDKGALYQFARKVEFYVQKTGRQVNRKLVVTPTRKTARRRRGGN